MNPKRKKGGRQEGKKRNVDSKPRGNAKEMEIDQQTKTQEKKRKQRKC